MRIAARIVYLVGAISCLITTAVALTIGVVYVCIGVVTLAALGSNAPKGDITPYVVFLIVGSVFLVFSAIPALAGIACFGARSSLARESTNKAPHIVAIVFGALSGSAFPIVGAVLSLIQIVKWNNRRKNTIDVEAN